MYPLLAPPDTEHGGQDDARANWPHPCAPLGSGTKEADKEKKNESLVITKSQLVDLIREEAAKEMDRHQKGEKLLQSIGGLKGRSEKDLRAALEKAAADKEGYEKTDVDDAMGLAGYGKIHSDS